MDGGMREEVTAVLSARYEEIFDNDDTMTRRILVGRLCMSSAVDANRNIRLRCLPGCADATMSTAGVATPQIVPLPTGAPQRRTPIELSKDLDAYVHVVTLAQYSQILSLSAGNVKALVTQDVHLDETGQQAIVVSTAIRVINTCANHMVRGTTNILKQTMLDDVAQIEVPTPLQQTRGLSCTWHRRRTRSVSRAARSSGTSCRKHCQVGAVDEVCFFSVEGRALVRHLRSRRRVRHTSPTVAQL